MQVSINSIKVQDRVRTEVGDLSSLMASMQKHGQLSPVILTRTNDLIAGYRRLLAARKLGWYTVDATYVTFDTDVERLEIELEENVHRRDFTPSELLEGYSRLEKLKRPRLWTRVANFFRSLFQKVFRRKKKSRLPAADSTSEMDVIGQG